MNALVELALAISERERKSSDVSPLVKKAMEKHQLEREEAASNDIVALLRKIDAHKSEQRKEIRSMKAQLKQRISGLGELDRAWDYAQQTNNFLPVLRHFDMVQPSDLANPNDFGALTTVPAEFEVPDSEG